MVAPAVQPQLADPIQGILAHLLADANIVANTKGRIYGGQMPKEHADLLQQEPSTALVVSYSGPGAFDAYTTKIAFSRIQYRIVGPTDWACMQLWWTLFQKLNGVSELVVTDIRILSMWMGGAPLSFHDPDIHLPSVIGFGTVVSQVALCSS